MPINTNGATPSTLTQARSSGLGSVQEEKETKRAQIKLAIEEYFNAPYKERDAILNTWKDQGYEYYSDKLRTEEERIQHIRERFSTNHDKVKLLAKLQSAFVRWRAESGLPGALDAHYTQEYSAENATGVIKPPLHELKAGVMYFDKSSDGSAWNGVDCHHEHCSGTFPDQKITMENILEDGDHNPFMAQDEEGDKIKYFHFPANHMDWVERAIAIAHREHTAAIDKRHRTNHVLSREHWRGQLHGSGLGKSPVHARHMRSRCSSIPLDTQSGVFTEKGEHTAKSPPNFAIFLPYLHWETDRRRQKMAQIVREVTRNSTSQALRKGATVDSHRSGASKGSSKRNMTIAGVAETVIMEERFKNKTPLGLYLLTAVQLLDAMEHDVDERLVRHGLGGDPCEPPLHIRRTLDQSYFLTISDTSERDKDQVVYRETKPAKPKDPRCRDIARVVMVDQLWLWILDERTIITSFPRRWGRNKPDSSGVHKSLRERLRRAKDIQSVYHLALLIIDQCSRIFFDRTKPTDQRPEVMDLFAAAIGKVTDLTTTAFEDFWSSVEKGTNSKVKWDDEQVIKKWLNINPEGVLLRESQDIVEELGIMRRIYKQQLDVVRDFRKYLRQHWGESKHPSSTEGKLVRDLFGLLLEHKEGAKAKDKGKENENPNTSGDTERESRKKDIEFSNDCIEQITNRESEIHELEGAAARTTERLQQLLQLKQQQASIVEAKAALQRADETIRQGRAIMAFTIVTIFFLPLGFFATFFGMNNEEINQAHWMTLGQQVGYMFGFSAVVIILALSVAFIPFIRALAVAALRIPSAFIWEFLGFRLLWSLCESIHINDARVRRATGRCLRWIHSHPDRVAAHKEKKAEANEKDEEEPTPGVETSPADPSAPTQGLQDGNHASEHDKEEGCLARFRRHKTKTTENGAEKHA